MLQKAEAQQKQRSLRHANQLLYCSICCYMLVLLRPDANLHANRSQIRVAVVSSLCT